MGEVNGGFRKLPIREACERCDVQQTSSSRRLALQSGEIEFAFYSLGRVRGGICDGLRGCYWVV